MRYSILSFVLFLCLHASAQELTIQEKIDLLKQENEKLQEMQKKLEDATASFEEVKKNTDHVLEQSSLNLRENMIRVIASGLKDMFESTVETSTNWIAGITIVTLKVVNYYRDQWMSNAIKSDYHNENLNLEGVAQNMKILSDRNNDVYRKVSVMDYCVRLPLEYYDDDNRELIRQFPEIAPYWKEADGTNDDDTEKSIRKLNVLRNTSKAASEKLGEEIQKMKNDAEQIQKNIEANNARINELGRQINTWNANLEKPEHIDYSNTAEKPEPTPVTDKNGLNWDDCLYIRKDNLGDDEREGYGEEWKKRMQEYHQKGYRFMTKITGMQFPEKITYGDEVKYTYNYSNTYLGAPGAVYLYDLKITVNGIETDTKNSRNYKPGKNTIVFTLSSCNKLVDQVTVSTTLVHPINEVEVYWEDPLSEIDYKRSVSFIPKIHHPTIDKPERNLNYYFKYIFDDIEQDSRNTYKFSPHLSLLTPGKHEVVVQLYDGFTNELADQYLHHLTVLEPQEGSSSTSKAANTVYQKPTNKPDYSNMEGQSITALDLGWAKYNYVFKSNQVRIDGYYFWNNQKVNYTSEPLKSYTPGVSGVPGMLMTKTSGYHIYQTTDTGNENAGCGNFIVTQMKGLDIRVLHRIKACSFNIVPAQDMSKITVKYADTLGGAMKEIVLY